jgi:hypothetical protein
LEKETDRFMMRNTVPEGVDFVQFIENIRVIILVPTSGTAFIRENIEKSSPCYSVLKRRKHIFPDSEVEIGKQI